MLVELKRLNAVSEMLFDEAYEVYAVYGIDMFDAILDLSSMITADPQILNQVYEMLENDVEVFEIIDIIDIIEI